MTRIAVNALPLMAVHTGIARYIRCLYRSISLVDGADIEFISLGKTSRQSPGGAVQGGCLEKLLSLHPRLVYMMRSSQWILYEQYLTYILKKKRFDILHESFYTPAKINRLTPQVFTLHDLSLIRFPETHSEDRRCFFNRFFSSRLAEADHIIVPSGYIKRELCDVAQYAASSVSVIPEGVDVCFYPQNKDCVATVRRRHDLPPDYLLFVGTLEPRKNLAMLLNALSSDSSKTPLVIAGWSGWGDPLFRAELERLGLRDRVHFIGYVCDEDLAALYSGALAFLYPSAYEGFGLPVLEAMACGCPVICSNAASIPEVAGDAALYAAPFAPDQWAEKIDLVIHDDSLRGMLIEAGKKQATKFTWHAAAEQTLALFSQIASRS